MASFRFIHCADLHIDSPLRGLEADPDAPADRIRSATRDAFSALVDYAIAAKVDFVVAAGDLYDGEWQDWRTGQFLVREVARLSEAGIPFVAIRGNHDAQSVISRELRFREPACELGSRRPETRRLDHLGVVIHGQSFANAAEPNNLSRGYPPPEPGKFNVGVLHTNVDDRPGHGNYAPSALADLRAHGYQYWALGHVHTRANLWHDPWIVYPGNLQGRSVWETGPRGACIVSVVDNVIVSEPEFIAFDTVRWEIVKVDVSGIDDLDGALAAARQLVAEAVAGADGRLLAARVRLEGVTAACAALSRSPSDFRERLRADLAGLENIWIESVVMAVSPPRQADVSLGPLVNEIRGLDFAGLGGGAAKYVKDMLDRLPSGGWVGDAEQ
jgi:DNA repair exonuclease SbcCD nuclease subunit